VAEFLVEILDILLKGIIVSPVHAVFILAGILDNLPMSESAKRAGNGNFQILVVDDEPTVCLSIKLLLQRDGHEVSGVESGEVALTKMAERRFDLVITDFFMPGMRGDELIARIRKLTPKQPIVLVSGSMPERELGPISNHIDGYLEKPFSLESLRKAVDRAVRCC
jgi:CheY-like chemotaxis protein